jgi:hypothetical protein
MEENNNGSDNNVIQLSLFKNFMAYLNDIGGIPTEKQQMGNMVKQTL